MASKNKQGVNQGSVSRRGFLKRVGASSAALSAVPMVLGSNNLILMSGWAVAAEENKLPRTYESIPKNVVLPDPSAPGPIKFINPNIPKVRQPEYLGRYYDARVPDTLDLAERGRLAINALTGVINPNCAYEMYCAMNVIGSPPYMFHNECDVQTQGKLLEEIALMRNMSGSLQNLDKEFGLMKVMLMMQGPDGLLYTPSVGRPWVLPAKADPNGTGLPTINDGKEQVASLGFGNTRVLSAFLMYARKDPSGPWADVARRLVQGYKKVCITEGDIAYPFSTWTTPDRLVAKPPTRPVGQYGAFSCWMAKCLMRYDKVMGDPEATVLAAKISRYALLNMGYFGPDGKFLGEHLPGWMGGDPSTAQYYSHVMVILASLEAVERTGDKELLDGALKAFEFGVKNGEPLVGYFPGAYTDHKEKQLFYSETCQDSEMIEAAIKISRLGIDKWDYVDRWIRNQLAENQLTQTGWLTDGHCDLAPYADQTKSYIHPYLKEGQMTTDRVIERNLGAFAGTPLPNDWVGDPTLGYTSFACCTPSGSRALYYVWRDMLDYHKDEVTLRINLLLNRASRWADIDSYIPYIGRVDIKPKQKLNLEVRIPEWVKLVQVKCKVAGHPRAVSFDGRYAQVGSVNEAQSVTLTFPIFERTTKVNIEGTDYTLIIRGNDVVSIDPPGKICPLYQGRVRYRTGKPEYKTVSRFISDEDYGWW